MPWYPPWAGEIFFLRTLLWHIPGRSFSDMYGGFASFREHCISLGLIENNEEYLYAIRDAIADGMSPAHCRHLFALCIATPDSIDVSTVWRDDHIREYLRHDFIVPDPSSSALSPAEIQVCETLCLMDIAVMVQGMGVIDFNETFNLKNLPRPPNADNLAAQHDSLRPKGVCVFDKYSGLIGYSVPTRAVVPHNEREVFRYLTQMPILTHDQVANNVATLNFEQRRCFDTILTAFEDMRNGRDSGRSRLFNINASAGCGKTYTMNRILEAIRLSGAMTMSVCSIGIGALHFPDGRTVHSAFAIPIDEEKDILDGPTVVSRLEKVLDKDPPHNTNARIELIRATQFFSWDEIGTIKNNVFHAVDRLFRRIMGSNQPFGGKMVVTMGDWRQIPPVDDSEQVRFWDGDQEAFESIFNISVKASDVFITNFQELNMQINERARHDPTYQYDLQLIGDGILAGDVNIASLGIRCFTTIESACTWLFDEGSIAYDPMTVATSALLSPYNKTVDIINDYCEQAFLEHHKSEVREFLSVDAYVCEGKTAAQPTSHRSCTDHHVFSEALSHEEHSLQQDVAPQNVRASNGLRDDVPPHDDYDFGAFEGAAFDVRAEARAALNGNDAFCVEILNGMTFKGVPPHRLRLYVGCVVILLRNIDPANRLQNGVRLFVKGFLRGGRVIAVTKAEDELVWEPPLLPPRVFVLHRIKFQCSLRAGHDAVVTRRQFPVRICNSVSAHKCQSMTLNRAVFDVRDGVFEHGQTFVAMSRTRMRVDLAFLVREGQTTFRNIVLQSFVSSARNLEEQ